MSRPTRTLAQWDAVVRDIEDDEETSRDDSDLTTLKANAEHVIHTISKMIPVECVPPDMHAAHDKARHRDS